MRVHVCVREVLNMYQLVGEHKHGLEREAATTLLEAAFQRWAQEVHHESVYAQFLQTAAICARKLTNNQAELLATVRRRRETADETSTEGERA